MATNYQKWKGPYTPAFKLSDPMLPVCDHIQILAKRIDFEYESETDIGIKCMVCDEITIITFSHE